MGSPKHALAHPSGGSWGGFLAGVFRSLFPEGSIQILGDPLPDHPDWGALVDPREGPAAALRFWAPQAAPDVDRWWVVACDQVRWTPHRLQAWADACVAADPALTHWVMARHGGRLQPLGSWLPARLLPHLAALPHRSLVGLAEALPHLVLDQAGPEWRDVDTPEERADWERGHP